MLRKEQIWTFACNKKEKKALHKGGLAVSAVWHSLQFVWFFSTASHLQMSDTGVILICFSSRSEMSWTKAHFAIHSSIEVQYVSKIFAQTLYLISWWEVIQHPSLMLHPPLLSCVRVRKIYVRKRKKHFYWKLTAETYKNEIIRLELLTNAIMWREKYLICSYCSLRSIHVQ